MMHVDRIDTSRLPDGLRGTRRTLALMAACVRKDAGNLALRQRALSIVQNCGGHDFSCEIRALFHYCRDAITYRRDPVDVEWVQDAARTISVFGSGDCDDKCVCLATLLATLGHRSRFVCIGPSREQFLHVYLEVHTKRGWLPLDPTPEQAPAGWEARGQHRAVYEIWPTGDNSALTFLAVGILAFWLLKRG